MDYATLPDLLRVSLDGWTELAQRSTRDPRVTADLFQAVAEGADTSAWPVDLVALAAGGVAALATQLTAASRYADSFISGRYPAGLTAEQLAASDLPTVVATIALRRAYGQSVTAEHLAATKWADDFLRAVAAGTASLVPAQAAPSEAEAEVLYHFSPRAVTEDELRGFA